MAMLNKDQSIKIKESFIAYITLGKGMANQVLIKNGDLISGDSLNFTALDNVQLIIVHSSS